MKSFVRGTSALFFAAAILIATMQPAAAAFTWYDWTTGSPQIVGSLISNPPTSLEPGRDILSARYAANADYRYFRMDLAGAPDTGANNYAPLYSILIGGSSSLNTMALSNPFPPPR